MNNRKKFYVYPEFQNKLVVLNIISMLVFSGIIGAAVYFNYQEMLSLGTKNGFQSDHPFQKFISGQYSALTTYLVVGLVTASLISTVLNIIFSLKLVGPILRLKDHLQKISRGEIENYRLQFREGDAFLELPDHFNAALDKIQKDEEKKNEVA
jgi:uncharacterized membrane protein YraQ (UPF0718 family)